MEKLYVNEIRADGEVSTVGLFYSRVEADNIVAALRKIPEKRTCRYEITDMGSVSASQKKEPPATRRGRAPTTR